MAPVRDSNPCLRFWRPLFYQLNYPGVWWERWVPTPLPRKNGFTDRRVCRFATLPYYFRCYPRTAATPDGTVLHSGASPGMLVLGGGFEPTYLAIISRVPIPNWRPQYIYQESVRVLSLNFNRPMSRGREVRLNFLG